MTDSCAKETGPEITDPTGEKVSFDTRVLNKVLETGRSLQAGESIDPILKAVALYVLARLPEDARKELLFVDSPENVPVLDAIERAAGRVSEQVHKIFAEFAQEVRQIASNPAVYRSAVEGGDEEIPEGITPRQVQALKNLKEVAGFYYAMDGGSTADRLAVIGCEIPFLFVDGCISKEVAGLVLDLKTRFPSHIFDLLREAGFADAAVALQEIIGTFEEESKEPAGEEH
jgi:hypothetical protein